MARARHEADAQPLEVVVRAIAGVDLELAAVARAGIDMADGKSAPEMLEHRLAQALLDLAQRWIARGAGSVTILVRAICFRMVYMARGRVRCSSG